MIRTEYKGSEWLFPFVAYTPEKIEGTLPLVVQLHGAGERGEDNVKQFGNLIFDLLYQIVYFVSLTFLSLLILVFTTYGNI